MIGAGVLGQEQEAGEAAVPSPHHLQAPAHQHALHHTQVASDFNCVTSVTDCWLSVVTIFVTNIISPSE